MKKSFLLLLICRVAYAAPVSDSTAPLDAVVITASPFLHTLFEQAQPVTFLSGDNLKLRLESTVGETLGREPGITSTYFGPGASRPIIRGLGDDRIRVLSNGVNMLDVANVSPDHQVTACSSACARISRSRYRCSAASMCSFSDGSSSRIFWKRARRYS